MAIGLTSGTLTIGSAAATGAITLDPSTKTHTLNIGSGTVESGLTKTVNIGTGGVSGTTTTINIGPTAGSSTTSVNGVLKTSYTNTAASWYLGTTTPTDTTRLNYNGWLYATQFEGTIDGGTWA